MGFFNQPLNELRRVGVPGRGVRGHVKNVLRGGEGAGVGGSGGAMPGDAGGTGSSDQDLQTGCAH